MPVASKPKKQAINSESITEYLLQLFDEYKIPKDDDNEKDTGKEFAFEMGKIVYAEICNIMLKMDEQYQENFNTIKTELEELRARDVEKESRLKDFEIKLSQLLVENKKQEDTIVKLSKIIEDSREENSKVGVTDGKNDDTTDTAVTAASDERKGQFSEVEKRNLKSVIARYKKDQRDYFNRSVKVSNLGEIPKQTDVGSRFVTVQKLLRKKGLDFLLTRSESFFVYSNSAVRFTFKTYVDRNHLVSRARKVLKNNGDRNIWIESLVTPENIERKRSLIQLGKQLKESGEIIRYSVECWNGVARLRTVSKNFQIDWLDLK